MQQRRRKNY